MNFLPLHGRWCRSKCEEESHEWTERPSPSAHRSLTMLNSGTMRSSLGATGVAGPCPRTTVHNMARKVTRRAPRGGSSSSANAAAPSDAVEVQVASVTPWLAPEDKMRLGGSELMVPVIGVGAWAWGDRSG